MGERLHVPVPADAALPPRPRDLRRRRRARGLAVRRARREQRHSRTPTTSSGSCGWCWTGSRPSGCSTATTASGRPRPTRTSSTRRARPTSSRPRARSRAPFATPCCRSRGGTPSRAAWSTAAGCRCRAIHTESPLNTPDRHGETFAGSRAAGRAGRRRAGDGTGLHVAARLSRPGLHAARVRCRRRADGRGGAAARPHPVPRGPGRRRVRRRPHRRAGRRRAGRRALRRPSRHVLPAAPGPNVCARWRSFDAAAVRAAIARATARD